MRFIISLFVTISLTVFLTGCSELKEIIEFIEVFIEDDSEPFIEVEEQPDDEEELSELLEEVTEFDEEEDVDVENRAESSQIDIEKYLAPEGEVSSANFSEILQLILEANENAASFSANAHLLTENVDTGQMVEDINISVKTIKEPFIQYFVQDVILGADTSVEWYATEDMLYVYTEQTDWVKTTADFMSDARNMIHDAFFVETIQQYEEFFELREDEDHYIIMYVGDDEYFAEIFNMDPVFNLHISGQSRLRFSKDTYLMVSRDFIHIYKNESTGVIEEIAIGEYQYTNDDVAPFEVPEEVISSAVLF